MKIKKYSEFEKIEEGIFKNLLISSLISLGIMTNSNASNISSNLNQKIERVENDRAVVDFIKFMKNNNISLNRKYPLKTIISKFEEESSSEFKDVFTKLNPKKSPISMSLFTFSARESGLINIPVLNLDINISDKFKVSFWDSGWFPGSKGLIGTGINYKFNK